MSPTAAERYTQILNRFLEQADTSERVAGRLAHLRLLLFVVAGLVGVAAWREWLPWRGWPWTATAIGLVLALFVVVAVKHDRVLKRARRARIGAELNLRGLARLRGELSSHPWRGERFLENSHPYAPDLDLFGPASLFQRLDCTATAWGEERLARWLLAPADAPTIERRQQLVRQLAPRLEARQELEIEGRLLGATKPDPTRLVSFCETHPPFALPAWLRLAAWVSPALLIGAIAAWWWDLAPWPPCVILLAIHAVVLSILRKRVAAFLEPLVDMSEALFRYSELFSALEPLAPELGTTPRVALRRFSALASWIRMREQPLFHLPLNALTLFDLHHAHALGRWQLRHREAIRGWFDTLAEIEALGSFAALAFECPEYAFPTIAKGPCLEAEALGHPLIPGERRVCNDVALGDPVRALIITGSNMAGKTTFLRTLGVASAMALAGAPVCARSLRLSPLAIATSMRVRDSLAEGVSFFYAELRRLKQVVDGCREGPSLFLLDEVLQGTNTAERQRASQSLVRQMVAQGALGGVATHDLALTELEPLSGGRIANVHFTDHLEAGAMTFDYRMRPGVVTTTNALALIEKIGIVLEPT